MIDTHAHLEPAAAPAVLDRARAAGVERVIVVATTIPQATEALALVDAQPGVYACLGVHPHEAGSPADLDELRRLLGHERAVAVGETGLDYYRDYAPRDKQERLFAAMLAVAAQTDKPAVIHTRAADADTLAALQDFGGRVVLHCFSSPHLLEPALERGWYISFAGNASFPKAVDLRLAAREVPAGRILAETDAPYLAPQPVRGRPNEPAYVMYTLVSLAQARNEDPGELERQIDQNASECFGL